MFNPTRDHGHMPDMILFMLLESELRFEDTHISDQRTEGILQRTEYLISSSTVNLLNLTTFSDLAKSQQPP